MRRVCVTGRYHVFVCSPRLEIRHPTSTSFNGFLQSCRNCFNKNHLESTEIDRFRQVLTSGSDSEAGGSSPLAPTKLFNCLASGRAIHLRTRAGLSRRHVTIVTSRVARTGQVQSASAVFPQDSQVSNCRVARSSGDAISRQSSHTLRALGIVKSVLIRTYFPSLDLYDVSGVVYRKHGARPPIVLMIGFPV